MKSFRCIVLLMVLLVAQRHARAADNLLAAALDSITVADLRSHAGVLADDTLEGRGAGSRGGLAAAKYLRQQLMRLGTAPAGRQGSYFQQFAAGYRNVLATIEGSDPELRDEYVLVCAHFDHVGYGKSGNSYGPVGYIHNGADDNASGVAVILEALEALQQLGRAPRRSLLLAFWDGEEQGMLGSKHWIRNPTVSLANVRLCVNIDMVGRLRKGRLEVGGTRSGFGLRKIAATPTLSPDVWIDFNWEMKENSDHWPFFQRRVPVLLLHTGLHDDYHRPGDDLEKLNLLGMRDIVRYVFELTLKAGDHDELPSFRATAQRESTYTRRRHERRLAPLPPRLGVTYRDAPQRDVEAAAEPDSELELATGVLVTQVRAGSAAAGVLRVGDRIIKVGEQPIADANAFQRAIMRSPTETRLTVVRGEDSQPEALPVTLGGSPLQIGISWRADDAEPEAIYLTRVVPGSPAASAGLRVLDRIYEVNGEGFQGLEAFGRLIQTAQQNVDGQMELLTETRGRVHRVVVEWGG